MFYVYENWRAKKKAVIHKSACSHCNSGTGQHKNKTEHKNRCWHGPFNNIDIALKTALSFKDRAVSYCGICLCDKI